jgi:hypothetical protein
MLSITRPRFEVANRRVRKKTFGNATSRLEREPSGPRKMTVGWVIFTVPRRNKVSQAVVVDTRSDKTETAIAIICHPPGFHDTAPK